LRERVRPAVRYALKVAYDGTRFAGSQAQPDVRTVHGEVAKALAQLDPEAPATMRWAGRTDAGVSARANVLALETTHPAGSLLPALSFRMEDAWAWALAPVDEAFEPRRARRRHYRYFLRTRADAPRVEAALRPFVGTHDFTGFCRLEPGVNPQRTVLAATARPGPSGLVVVDVEGESFLWNQVRRMVEAARREAEGEIGPEAIQAALRAAKPADLGTAPPEGLLLVDVEHPGLAWTAAPARVLGRLRARVEAQERALAVARAMLGEEGA
jgi:tRNA pseudouridine38-40 synthase